MMKYKKILFFVFACCFVLFMTVFQNVENLLRTDFSITINDSTYYFRECNDLQNSMNKVPYILCEKNDFHKINAKDTYSLKIYSLLDEGWEKIYDKIQKSDGSWKSIGKEGIYLFEINHSNVKKYLIMQVGNSTYKKTWIPFELYYDHYLYQICRLDYCFPIIGQEWINLLESLIFDEKIDNKTNLHNFIVKADDPYDVNDYMFEFYDGNKIDVNGVMKIISNPEMLLYTGEEINFLQINDAFKLSEIIDIKISDLSDISIDYFNLGTGVLSQTLFVNINDTFVSAYFEELLNSKLIPDPPQGFMGTGGNYALIQYLMNDNIFKIEVQENIVFLWEEDNQGKDKYIGSGLLLEDNIINPILKELINDDYYLYISGEYDYMDKIVLELNNYQNERFEVKNREVFVINDLSKDDLDKVSRIFSDNHFELLDNTDENDILPYELGKIFSIKVKTNGSIYNLSYRCN